MSSRAIQFGCAETYDAFGNRLSQQPSGTGLTCTSINTPVNANNRLSGPTYSSDAAGNLLYDGTNTLTYDREGRLATSFSPTIGGTATYLYGADGQRVNKTFGSFQTEYIRDPDGSLLAIYVNGSYVGNFQDMWVGGKHFGEATVASGNASQTENFALTNWLSSQAAYTSPATGVPTAAYLSLPFGDAQTDLFGSNNDDIHFTSKERDGESGNDYFEARYYASSMGRFMSPDDFWKDTNLADLQSLNKYAYSRNNSLRYMDLMVRQRPKQQ
ncbi:RHS repeat-associated core domain-containing protein [Terracidiphilus gabretensis]|uniref:RHS repeat-associated core domain-containing protein n=1 Tax=Terracidiphilus gabretensis TaxID=1577687 RepID=UPI00071BAE2F|nr:RHS repeat-associated core domain-containing protein [Terracidiphilus gabretensis]